MEIYKDLSSPASQKFEELLNTQLSKNKIEEGNGELGPRRSGTWSSEYRRES